MQFFVVRYARAPITVSRFLGRVRLDRSCFSSFQFIIGIYHGHRLRTLMGLFLRRMARRSGDVYGISGGYKNDIPTALLQWVRRRHGVRSLQASLLDFTVSKEVAPEIEHSTAVELRELPLDHLFSHRSRADDIVYRNVKSVSDCKRYTEDLAVRRSRNLQRGSTKSLITRIKSHSGVVDVIVQDWASQSREHVSPSGWSPSFVAIPDSSIAIPRFVAG
ncbi:hypothetical protein MRX96_032049 [Rhipicephalus microplus]